MSKSTLSTKELHELSLFVIPKIKQNSGVLNKCIDYQELLNEVHSGFSETITSIDLMKSVKYISSTISTYNIIKD